MRNLDRSIPACTTVMEAAGELLKLGYRIFDPVTYSDPSHLPEPTTESRLLDARMMTRLEYLKEPDYLRRIKRELVMLLAQEIEKRDLMTVWQGPPDRLAHVQPIQATMSAFRCEEELIISIPSYPATPEPGGEPIAEMAIERWNVSHRSIRDPFLD